MKYKNIEIQINFEEEESRKHLEEDFNVLLEKGIENIIIESFIPWLLGTDSKDINQNKIFKGLDLYEIDYSYSKIVAQYSPTGKEEYFGEFKFCFESGNRHTSDLLEAAAMEVYILDGEIVKIESYDI